MKIAEKLGFNPSQGMNAMMMRQQGMSQGMGKLYEEGMKLNGLPVLQIVKMAPAGQEVKISEKPEVPQVSESSSSGPSAGEAVKKSILGGFGGFGRRKKQEEPPPEETPQQGQAEATLMEMAVVSSHFSSAPVDESRFQVPAGFKQVKSEMAKMAEK